MRISEETEKFICDCCGKESDSQVAGVGFPYEVEWCYLYNFEFKLAKNGMPGEKDKHFCSKQCLKDYVNISLDRSSTCLFG